MKEKEEMFAFCLIGRTSEDPVVRFGFNRLNLLERMYPFFERDGGALYEIYEFDVDPSFRDAECIVELKNGKPWKLIHKKWNDESELPEDYFFTYFILSE